MIELFFNTILTNAVIFSYGSLTSIYIFNEKISKNNISEKPLFGIIFIGFLTLILNFFIPINKIAGTIILLFGLLFLVKLTVIDSQVNKKIIKNIIISSVITILLLSFSNIYRPDAGLYHLPYLSLINDNKIIIGAANINFRFAINSIAQYLSASQNNYIYNQASISIPLASAFSFSIIFMIRKMFKEIRMNRKLISISIFLISIFCLISFGRFSNYGNDAISHLYFFILIIFILSDFQKLKFDKLSLNKIALLSIFLFTTKAFMFLILLIPFIFFIKFKSKKKFLLSKSNCVNSVILIAWIVKSVIISGCIIYPVNETCFKNFKIYDENKIVLESKSGEAWAKGWINQENKILNFEEYNKNFNWLNTWKAVHLNKIIEKLTPYLIFLLLFISLLFFQKKESLNIKKNDINFVFFISIMLSIVWFLKFPLYRYGSAFLVNTIIILFIYIIYYLDLIPKKNTLIKNFKIFILISSVAFLTKNFLRIDDNSNMLNNKIWPDIYSEKNDYKKNQFELIKDKNNNKLYYFSSGKLCMYSQSPCSNYKVQNLYKEKKFSYDIYWIK